MHHVWVVLLFIIVFGCSTVASKPDAPPEQGSPSLSDAAISLPSPEITATSSLPVAEASKHTEENAAFSISHTTNSERPVAVLSTDISKISTIPKIDIVFVKEIPSTIESTVQLAPGEYNITQRIQIKPNGKLILSPGTTLHFQEAGIVCLGTLIAQGTESKPIIFDTPDSWDNITIAGPQAQGILEYCEISGGLGMLLDVPDEGRYIIGKGKMAVGGAILYADQSTGAVRHCKFTHNFSLGCIALAGVQDVQIHDNFLAQNENYAIWATYSKLDVYRNTIAQNQGGIVTLGKSKGKIAQNKIQQHRVHGILTDARSELSIEENTFTQNSVAILSEQNSAVSIKRNQFKSNMIGFIGQKTSSSSLEDNIFQNHAIAILAEGFHSLQMKGNKIQDSELFGLVFQEMSAVELIGNQIIRSPCCCDTRQMAQIQKEQNQWIDSPLDTKVISISEMRALRDNINEEKYIGKDWK